MDADTRIAVVGGGPSGLAAAYRLQRAGAGVVVYEAQPWVGGRARTDRLDGFAIDAGAQLLASMYTRALGLVDELGLRSQVARSPGLDALWRGGRAYEVTYGSVASMLASGALGIATKMRLGASYLPFLARHADALELSAPERAAEAGLDGESIAAWGERSLGREFVDSLVFPQLAAYYGSLPDETSAGLYHVLARYGTEVTLFALRDGIGGLCEALAERVRQGGGSVRLGEAVERVESGPDGVRVGGPGGEETYAGAVVALPGPQARGVLANPMPELRSWLEGVRFRPALTLALLLDRPVGVRYFGLSFSRPDAGVVAAACVEENKGAGLVPPGRGLLVAFTRADRAGELVDAEPRRIVDTLLPDLERVFPGVGRHVTRARVYRWPVGSPVFYPGYLRRLVEFRRGAVEGAAPLVLAGDYLSSATLEGAVTAGFGAADRLAHRLRSGRAPGV